MHAKEMGFLHGVEQSRGAMVTSVMRAFNNEDVCPASLAETFLSSHRQASWREAASVITLMRRRWGGGVQWVLSRQTGTTVPGGTQTACVLLAAGKTWDGVRRSQAFKKWGRPAFIQHCLCGGPGRKAPGQYLLTVSHFCPRRLCPGLGQGEVKQPAQAGLKRKWHNRHQRPAVRHRAHSLNHQVSLSLCQQHGSHILLS